MPISFIETSGGKLAVEVEGEGPLVVCSPAMGDIRDAYAPLASQLVEAGYRVARLDLRGHGDSSIGFNSYGDEAIAEDFFTVIEALGGGPAILAGSSLSAGAAVIAAGRRPERIAGLILLAPFLRNGMSEVVRGLFHAALAKPFGPAIWKMQSTKFWPGLGDGAKERAAHTTALLTRPGRWPAFRATVRGADHRVVAPWLGKVKVPVLIVIGDADPDWKDPVKEATWVASNFPGAELITVQNAGHAPMLERPEIVGPAVLQFLKKLRAKNPF